MDRKAEDQGASRGSGHDLCGSRDEPSVGATAALASGEPEWETLEMERYACAAQEGYQNPVAQVAFRAGFLVCREVMARFVEQGGDASTAASIRANWLPQFGDDPGGPRQYDFAEVAESDDMESGPWRSRNPGPSVDAAVYALTAMTSLGMALPVPALQPEASRG